MHINNHYLVFKRTASSPQNFPDWVCGAYPRVAPPL